MNMLDEKTTGKKTLDITICLTILPGVISALIAAFALWQTQKTINLQTEANRPYFRLNSESMKVIDVDDFSLNFEIENIGERPASNLSYGVYFLSIDFTNAKEPFGDNHMIIMGDVAQGIKREILVPFGINSIAGGVQEKQMIVLVVEYVDELTGKCTLQNPWFFVWPNVKDGQLGRPEISAKEISTRILNRLNQVDSFKNRNCD